MNILIVGAGKVGSTLADYLSRENHNVTIIHPHTALSSSYFCSSAPDYAAVPRQAPPPFGTIHRFISLTSFSSIDSPLTAQKQWGVLYV